MSAEKEQQPQNNEPIEQGEEQPNKYFYTVYSIGLVVLIFTIITVLSGQWTKEHGSGNDTIRAQVNLWANCVCRNMDAATDCAELQKIFKAAQGFSVIAAIGQFFAVFGFGAIYANVGSNGASKGLGLFGAVIAIVALIITIGAYGGLYNETYCGQSLENFGDLDWCFGLRIVEVVLWIVATALLATSGGKGVNQQRAALFLAVFVLALTIATTVGRGWITREPVGQLDLEYGLWEACNCTNSKHYECAEERRLFRAQQAFASLAVLLQAVFVFAVIFDLPRTMHVVISFLAATAILISFGVFASWYNEQHCGQPAPSNRWQLFWPFGLQCCAFILDAVLFVITIVGACGNF